MILQNDSPRGVVLIKSPETANRGAYVPRDTDIIPVFQSGRASRDLFEPDVTTAENWSRMSTGASAPLPDGSRVTYHIAREPRTLSFTGLLTDHALLPSGVPAVLPQAGGLPNSGLGRRSVDLFSTLQAWERERTLVAAVGSFDILPLAFIESMGTPRTPDDGMAITFEITLREVITYDTRTAASVDLEAVQVGAIEMVGRGKLVAR